MKNILRVSLSILCGFLISHSAIAATKSNDISLDRIVAIVNDTPITQTELNEAIATTKKQIAATGTSLPPADVLRKQILQQLIDRKIQLQLADQAGVNVDDAQVEKAIGNIAKQNKMTTAQLFEQLKIHGINVDEYKKEIREEIALEAIQQHEVAQKIVITPQEVDDFTRSKAWQASNNKEYHLEDILISLPEAPTSQQIQDAKNHAQALLTKLHNGLSFHSAAIAESSGNKAMQGGDLGWRKLPEIPSAFAEQIINVQADDIIGPIQTPNGFHIIHVAGVRESSSKTKTSNKQIEQFIFQRKFEEGLQSWITKIRSEAFINMHPES